MELRPNSSDFRRSLAGDLALLLATIAFHLLPPSTGRGPDFRYFVVALAVPAVATMADGAMRRIFEGAGPKAGATLLLHGVPAYRRAGNVELRDGLLTFEEGPLRFAIGNVALGEPVEWGRNRVVFDLPEYPGEARLVLHGKGIRDLVRTWLAGPHVATERPVPWLVEGDEPRFDLGRLIRFGAQKALLTLAGVTILWREEILSRPYLLGFVPVGMALSFYWLRRKVADDRRRHWRAEEMGFRNAVDAPPVA